MHTFPDRGPSFKDQEGGAGRRQQIKNYYSFNTYSRNIILQPPSQGTTPHTCVSTIVCCKLPKSTSVTTYMYTPPGWCAELYCNQKPEVNKQESQTQQPTRIDPDLQKTVRLPLYITEIWTIGISIAPQLFHLTKTGDFLLSMAVAKRDSRVSAKTLTWRKNDALVELWKV